MPLRVYECARFAQRDDAADSALRDDRRIRVQSEVLADLVDESLLEVIETSRPLSFGDADDDWRSLQLDRRIGLRGFPNHGAEHSSQLGRSSPRLVERDFASDDPFAARVDETSLLEAIDSASDRRARSRRRQADARDHA